MLNVLRQRYLHYKKSWHYRSRAVGEVSLRQYLRDPLLEAASR